MTKRSNDTKTMWNGGETFGKQDNYNRMWRESEDYLDLVDIEKEIEGDSKKVKNNISSRTVIRERKLKRLSGLRNRSMKSKSQITSVVDNQNV